MNRSLRTSLSDMAMILGITVIQLLFIRFIAIGTVTADLLIPLLVYLALKRGQIPATMYGFCAGLLVDFFSGGMMGISALAKTVAGFSAGFFYNEDKTELLVRSAPFPGIVLLAAFLHNTVYLFAYFTTIRVDLFNLLLLHVAGSALYTTLLGLILMLLSSRTGTRLKV